MDHHHDNRQARNYYQSFDRDDRWSAKMDAPISPGVTN